MSDVLEKAESLAAHLKEYVNLKLDVVKLSIAEKTSALLANLFAGIIVGVLLLFVIVFGGIAGALALSAWIGKPYAGFLVVAGLFLLIAGITWLAKGKLIRFPIMNAIIEQLYQNEKQEDEKD